MNNIRFLKQAILPTAIVSMSAIGYYNYFYHPFKKKSSYTKKEISNHNTEKDAWVTYKNKVYDITKFIDSHPGDKENILMAAGGPIDIYWNLYKQHNTKYVENLLETFFIGELKDYTKEIQENEYANEPRRDPSNRFIHKQEPFNAELSVNKILGNYLTPEKNWFTRNHHPVPDIDTNSYRLIIDGKVLKYKDIIDNKISEITTTVQCAGNRRNELNKIEKTMGLPWKGGAISTGKWEGVWLDDIVKQPKDKKYINLYDSNGNFSVSVPIGTRLFLAFKMNGEPLSRDRGYPIRVIAPGLAGSKNVKWIGTISFSNKEVKSPWQSGIAYKILPSNIKKVEDITPELKDILNTITVLPIQSFICEKKIDGDFVSLKGYATVGKDKKIRKVEVSDDGGVTWKMATIYKGRWETNVWYFWKITLTYDPEIKYMCRATDEDGNTQDKTREELWNIRGIANNSVCVG